MKVSSILAGAFAALAVAAPTEKRGFNVDLSNVNDLGFNLADFNNLNFGSNFLQYLFDINSQSLPLSSILALSVGNNFDFEQNFGSLFGNNLGNDAENIIALLEFQKLATFAAIASTGALSGFNLESLLLGNLNFGAFGNSFGGFDINSLLGSSEQALIAPVLAQQVVIL